MSATITTRRVVVTSLLVDLFDIVSNLVVALITSSAVVFAEMAPLVIPNAVGIISGRTAPQSSEQFAVSLIHCV